MSNFDSKIYKIAKEYVRSKATANPSELNFIFEAENEFEAKQENDFALACLRLICKDTRAFIDPTKNSNEFSQMIKDLKLNELGGIDLGFGQGTSNNLLYRLANRHYSLKDKKTYSSKDKLLKFALNDDKFLKTLAKDRLNDRETYEVLTKQAFFNWHYKTFIQDLEYDKVIKKANPGDGSSNGWTSFREKEGFYISPTGAPFNTGTPVICCVIQEKIDNLKKIRTDVNSNKDIKDTYLSKAFDKMLAAFGKKSWTNLGEVDRSKLKVKVIDHTKGIPPVAEFNDFVFEIVDMKQGIVKFCFGLDYAVLNTLESISLPAKNYKNLSDIKTFVGKELNDKSPLVIQTFSATEEQETTRLFLDKINKASNILKEKDGTIQSGPALFFDIETEENKEAYNLVKQDLETYELIDGDTSTEILKAQYSPSGIDFGQSLRGVYGELIYNYYVKNRIQFAQFLTDLNPKQGLLRQDKATEDLKFYFKFNKGYPVLLAVGAEQKDSKKIEPNNDVIKTQNKSNPFEFSKLKDNQERPLYIDEIDKAYAVLKKVNFTGEAYGSLSTGISGEILFVTEFLLKEIWESKTPLAKKIKLLIDEENLEFKESLYDVIKYADILPELSATNNSFGPILLSTINGFVIGLNYILLSNQTGGLLDFSSANLSLGTSFFSSTDTFKDRDTIVLDNIGKFLEALHYPRLQIKPTVPKQKAATVEEPDAGLIKLANKNTLTSAKKKKEKVYDLNNYNSWFETGGKKILVTLAQASDNPCFEDLAKIISNGSIDQIFEFLLTKFPWDELLAESLLTNLRRTANLLEATDFADAVNACLKDGGIDDLLNSFARITDVLQNFDKILNSNIPEIPTIPELPSLFILDFQKVFRDAIFNATQEIVMAVLGQILGVMLEEVLGDCRLDGELDDLLNEKLKGSRNKTATGANQSPTDLALQSNIGELSDSGTDLNSVSVDIIAILRASRRDSLDNIFNGVLDLFPSLRIKFKAANSNPLVAIENYLSDLTDVLSALQTKNLLNRVADEKEYSKVKIFTENYSNKALKSTFLSNKNISLLFRYLSQFIDENLINQEIVSANIIIPDPCYVNFGRLSNEDINVLKELLGEDLANEYVRNSANVFSDQINSICSKLAGGVFNFANNLENLNLVSDSSKKSLQKTVDSSFDYLVALQNSTRSTTLQRASYINEYIKAAYFGTKPDSKPNGYYNGLNLVLGYKAFSDDQYKELFNLTYSDFEKSLNRDKIKSDTTFFSNQINLDQAGFDNLGPIYEGSKTIEIPFYSDVISQPKERDQYQYRFFIGLYYSEITKFGSKSSIGVTPIEKLIKDPVKLSNEITSIFQKPSELKTKYMEQFDEVIAEGGKNTNKFIANLQRMKSIINNAQGELKFNAQKELDQQIEDEFEVMFKLADKTGSLNYNINPPGLSLVRDYIKKELSSELKQEICKRSSTAGKVMTKLFSLSAKIATSYSKLDAGASKDPNTYLALMLGNDGSNPKITKGWFDCKCAAGKLGCK